MIWYILDENDNPVAADMWIAAKWMSEYNSRRIVEFTEVNSDCQLSTVFLCLDHGYRGQPMLYESLWFGGENAGQMRRYSTKEEASEGHKEMLQEYLLNLKV